MRCIKCGSKKVSLRKTDEGYSFAKGIIGQAVLGPIGAVAGINGKSSQTYHCSECGQDAITVMPEVIERYINEAVQKNDVRSLRDYKKQYPGIEWENTTSVTSQNETLSIEKNLIEERNEVIVDKGNPSNDEISVSTLENMIREYINEINAPVEKGDLCAKYEEQGRAKVQTAILNLKSKGKIKEVAEDIYVIVRDYEEMLRLIEDEKQQQQRESAFMQQKAPDLIKRASVMNNKIAIGYGDVVYYLDTFGTVHYLDSLLPISKRGSKSWREQLEFILENGQDVREFIKESYYTIFLMRDDSVRLFFSSDGKKKYPEWESYQKTIEGWADIVSICQDEGSFVALKRDGSLVAAGLNDNGQCNVESFRGVKKIKMDYGRCFVLLNEGTMAICGTLCDEEEEEENLHACDNWTDIVDFDTDGINIIGLHSVGSVAACGRVKQKEVKNWSNVVKVYAGAWNVAAITSDGRAYSTGEDYEDVNNWKSVVGLIVFTSFVAGLKADGTVILSGSTDYTDRMSDKICDWKDIVSFMTPGHIYSIQSIYDDVIIAFQKDGNILSSEPGLEDLIDNMKLFVNFDIIEEEEKKAEEGAISRLAEQAKLRKQLTDATEQLEEKRKDWASLEKEYNGSLATFNREKTECAVPADKEIKERNDRIRDLRNRVNSLGFFKKKEKKELERTIVDEEDALRKAEKERDHQKVEMKKILDEKIVNLERSYKEQTRLLTEEISSLQTKIAELTSVRAQKFSHLYEKWAEEDKEREEVKSFIIEEIKKYGLEYGFDRLSISDMRHIPGIKARNMDIFEITPYVDDLVAEGRLREEEEGIHNVFSVI